MVGTVSKNLHETSGACVKAQVRSKSSGTADFVRDDTNNNVGLGTSGLFSMLISGIIRAEVVTSLDIVDYAKRVVTLFAIVFIFALAPGCKKKAAAETQVGFSSDIRVVTPFTQPPVKEGKLYFSNGRLRVELGPMTDIYLVEQKKGWRTFPESKVYEDISEKDVSTYLPKMTNGSPCPTSEQPSLCKMVAKDNLAGRPATKWELVNHHGVHVFLWTDDKLGIAVRWDIENVTYEAKGIREATLADTMFQLPPDYTAIPKPKWAAANHK